MVHMRIVVARRSERNAVEDPRTWAVMLGAFALATALAAAFGATNFGTALAFGQIGFAAALVWVLIRR